MNTATIDTVTQMMRRVQTGQMSRRQLLRGLGALGLTTAGFAALGRRGALARQDAPASPAAAPVVGLQADGSTLWRVKVGDMRMDAPMELHTFFPGEITIAAGDSIWFDFGQMPMFHTVSFLSGGEMPPLLIPDPELPADATPAADGPKLVYNPVFMFPSGTATYDGTGYTSSGADIFRDLSVPYTLTFTAEGTFDFFCLPHASVMFGKVNVVTPGSTLPMDQAAYDAAAAEQMAAFYAQGEADMATYGVATATVRDDGTTLWEATVGGGGDTSLRIQAFMPRALEITAGDTVRWVNRSPGEPHTVTLLGAGVVAPEDAVELFADGSPKIVQNMEVLLPVGGPVFSGEGLFNSGFMGVPEIVDLPLEYELTFDTPGEYVPYCFLHGSPEGDRMSSTLIVKPKA